MKNTSQKGIALIETLLLIIIVALVAGIGWYVWHSTKQTNNSLSSAQSASQNAPSITKKKTTGSAAVSQKATSMPTSSNTAKSSDGKVQVTLPTGWKISSRIDGGAKCGFVDPSAGGTCVSDISFQDSTGRLSSYVKIFKSTMNPGSWYISVQGDCSDSRDITVNGHPGVQCHANTDKGTVENVVASGAYVAYFYGPDSASENSIVRSTTFL